MSKCQRCGEVDPDTRTLLMACGYEMGESKVVPYGRQQINEQLDDSGCTTYGSNYYPREFYTLTVCKGCRADWMLVLDAWFEGGPARRPSPGTGIFVRQYGASIEISEEEWQRRAPGRIPVRATEKLSPGKLASLKRPANYAELSESVQWAIDKALGILDWDGK